MTRSKHVVFNSHKLYPQVFCQITKDIVAIPRESDLLEKSNNTYKVSAEETTPLQVASFNYGK